MPYNNERLAALSIYWTYGERIWWAKVPIIFWHMIEFHCPNCVMCQFELIQNVFDPVDTNCNGVHQLDLADYPEKNWAQFHRGG